MAYDVAADPRLDPRLKAILSAIPPFTARDVDSRETLLAEANSAAPRQEAERFRSFMELCDTEEAAPSAGLRVRTEHVVSAPDDNTINLQVIRPDTDETLACVYYIHGGGMTSLSCYDGMYRSWGRLIAANGVAVVMVDFRNALVASSVCPSRKVRRRPRTTGSCSTCTATVARWATGSRHSISATRLRGPPSRRRTTLRGSRRR